MTSYKVYPDPNLLLSEIITSGVSPWVVRRLIRFSQSLTMFFFNASNVVWFDLLHSHCLVDFNVPFRFSINFLVSGERQNVD